MDTIYLHGLKVPTHIGVAKWEQAILQVLLIDIEFRLDTRLAAENDDIDQTIDYALLADKIISFGQQSCCLLIETFAQNLANFIFQEFNINWLQLHVRKPHAVTAANMVGLKIERTRI